MKYLKFIGLLVGTMIVMFLVIALFMPSKYYVERTIDIKAPVEVVYKQVADLNNYHEWNPWAKQDSKAIHSVSGTGIGQVYKWKGDTIGEGSLTNIKYFQNKQIDQTLKFVAPWESEAYNGVKFEQVGNSTKVIWIMEGDLDYPIGRYMKTMIEGSVTKDFDAGLRFLKDRCEGLIKDEISIVDFPGAKFYAIEESILNKDDGKIKIKNAIDELEAFIAKNKIVKTNPISSFTNSFDVKTGKWELLVLLPVDNNHIQTEGRIIPYEITTQKTVKSIHKGPLKTAKLTYEKMYEFIEKNGLKASKKSYEINVNHYTAEKEEDYLTEIYIFLE